MKKQISNYKSGYNTEAKNGAITLYFADKTSHNLVNLSLNEFNAALLVLQHETVYWNGTWINSE